MCTVAAASGRPASESGTLRHGDGTHRRSDRCRRSFVLPILCGSGFWAASVRVWHITSRGWDPSTERSLPEVVRVAYPLWQRLLGGQRPSLAHYVTGMGPIDGAIAA